MKISGDEVTVLPGSDPTFTVDAGTARMTDHFAHHVLGSVIFEAKSLRHLIILPTDWPFGDVIWPFVRSD